MSEQYDKYKIGEKMLSDWGTVIFPMTEERYNVISKIMNAKTEPLSDEDWDKILKKEDLYEYCALLTYSAPETVKIQAINNAKIIALLPNEEFFLPLLFSSDTNIAYHMSMRASNEFAHAVNLGLFLDKVNDYLQKNPDAHELPFSGTYVEKYLLERILRSDELSNERYDDYKTYRMIETYKNEEELKAILGDLSTNNECVMTAIMNNPHISDEMKQEAFLYGADITKIKTPQKNEIIKNIYSAVAMDTNTKEMSVYMLAQVSQCIDNLVKHVGLPESCELDLYKKVGHSELPIDITTMETMIEKTPYISVLKEVVDNSRSHRLLQAVLKNELSPDKMALDIINRCIDNTPLTPFYKKEIVLTAVRHRKISNELYNRIISTFKPQKDEIAKNLAINPLTPKSLLKIIIEDKENTDLSRAIAVFNLESIDSFSETSDCNSLECKRKFLNTVCAIANVWHYQETKMLPIKEQFFPDYTETENQTLRDILQKIINEKKAPAAQYAKKYLEIIEKKDMCKRMRDGCYTSIDSLTNKELETIKEETLDKVFCSSPSQINVYGTKKQEKTVAFAGRHSDYYHPFLIYRDLILYADIYQDITDKIEKRINGRQAKVKNTIDR